MIERHIDTARFPSHGSGVFLDGLLVESVDPGRLRGSPGGDNLPRYRVELRKRTTGMENSRSFAREKSQRPRRKCFLLRRR